MASFIDWLNRRNENYGGSANDPSNVEDEGDGGDGVEKRMEKPGAFPVYGADDLPITARNRRNKLSMSKKKCNCK